MGAGAALTVVVSVRENADVAVALDVLLELELVLALGDLLVKTLQIAKL